MVGTLANALVHHSGLVEDPYDLMDYLIEVVGSPTAGPGGGQRVRDLIAKLSAAASDTEPEPEQAQQ